MSIGATIISITFVSSRCFYCDNPWEHKLEVKTIDSETNELTGRTVEIRVCQDCRDTKVAAFEDRIRSSIPKSMLR